MIIFRSFTHFNPISSSSGQVILQLRHLWVNVIEEVLIPLKFYESFIFRTTNTAGLRQYLGAVERSFPIIKTVYHSFLMTQLTFLFTLSCDYFSDIKSLMLKYNLKCI